MGVRNRLAAAALGRTSVLVVEVPGWAATRWAVEREVRRRGWRPATSAADADVLVTCGVPEERLARALDLTYAQLPGPRARVELAGGAAAGAVLDQAAAELLDGARQRADAAGRPADPVMGSPAGGDGPPPGDDESEDESGNGSGDEDHGDMDMDMDDMDMAPGGIALAEGGAGDERDGLDLDVLHVPLGPVLPYWPAGLLLHCTVRGDVVAEARPEALGAAGVATDGEPAPAVEAVDRLLPLLALAGWEAAAATAARVRDELLDGADPRACAPPLERLSRRVHRSRLLRWSLRDLGALDDTSVRRHGLDPRLGGDVHDRLLAMTAAARAALDGTPPPAPAPVGLLPDLVAGLELAAVRLVVASLPLQTPAHRPAKAGQG